MPLRLAIEPQLSQRIFLLAPSPGARCHCPTNPRFTYLAASPQPPFWAVLDCFKARVQLIDKNFLGEARRTELFSPLSKIGYVQGTRFATGVLCARAIQPHRLRAHTYILTWPTFRRR